MRLVTFLLSLSLILAACSSTPPAATAPTQSIVSNPISDEPTPTATPLAVEVRPPSPQTPETADQAPIPTQALVRTDEQGMVTVEVTPVNLTSPGESFQFEVALNTHSVDLSMDLAPLATLTADTGKTVQAIRWDAPSGGHHVSGKLIFPASVAGRSILEGTKKLTLTLKNLDAPERVFSWDLNP